MTDLSTTIVPKSDQLNADDLIASSKTLKITGVKIVAGDQPVEINYEGGEGRPYKPCKSMRRLLITAWGSNGDNYVGRQMTVHNDTRVKWGGAEVGGIRISHMSDIDKELRVMLTESRGRKSPHVVKPIITVPLKELGEADYRDFEENILLATTMAELQVIGAQIKGAGYDADGTKKIKAVYSKAMKALRETNEGKGAK